MAQALLFAACLGSGVSATSEAGVNAHFEQ